ncbi:MULTISPECIES: putative toxin-antitoxin system toxin component, PIN family [unclassified Roseofilum]|uniref:putative toxin-antitoxin system toxin component, PIN family n=1 Tax=unclassified Roseofilum TaxID=2620099 RepID=UPI000E7D3318|nr:MULTISPECIES: putative toxin-antitoxin system toxin component, PIN family [unclassified Roseofilum]HBQ97451.1 putative toxin-antitoxin system toxin component, PIN family [Cyanobacteria bacterium UBA11691]
MTSRIVVDTSVFISALISPSGPSREVIRLCLSRQYQPILGNALFSEYESVVFRSDIFDQCSLTEEEILELFQAFLKVSEWVNIYFLWRPNLRDEADNHLIELALAGGASSIVTNNLKDFQNAELLFPKLSILKPEVMIRNR